MSADGWTNDDGEIRNAIGTYSQAVDDRRYDDLRSILADEFRFDIRGDVVDGPDAFIARISSAAASAERRCHVTSNVVVHIDADGARAIATSDLLYIGPSDGGPWTILRRGRYSDTLAKRQGRWVFLSRRVDP